MSRMKVVLREVVAELGEPGEVVVVAGGYARNFLIPRGLAVVATKGNLAQAEDWKDSRAAREAKERSNALRLKSKLEGQVLKVSAQAGPDGQLFGQVTPANVSEAVEAQLGVSVDRHAVELAEPIRHLGVHEAVIALPAGHKAAVTVEVETVS